MKSYLNLATSRAKSWATSGATSDKEMRWENKVCRRGGGGDKFILGQIWKVNSSHGWYTWERPLLGSQSKYLLHFACLGRILAGYLEEMCFAKGHGFHGEGLCSWCSLFVAHRTQIWRDLDDICFAKFSDVNKLLWRSVNLCCISHPDLEVVWWDLDKICFAKLSYVDQNLLRGVVHLCYISHPDLEVV